ncbi:MAG: glycosyltransferase [Flavobacteriales bacterium]|nr:glycosyltransferase [Flavobacteriales bacterium]
MKTIKELYHRLNYEKDFEKKYPGYSTRDDKIHVLYIGPCLNASGLYRMILPALEMNKTRSHAGIISNIHRWDFTKRFDDYDHPVDPRLIEWADYIVLPAMMNDASYILDTFLKKNKALEFVMDIDCNLHEIPEGHPGFRQVTAKDKDTLLANISKMDYLTAPSESLLDYYDRLIDGKHRQSHVFLDYFPNLLSNYIYEGIKDIFRSSSEKVRIGLVMNAGHLHDLAIIEKVIRQIMEKFKDKVELIVFGWKDNDAALKDIPVTWEKPVPVTEYFDTLNNLMFDIALLPLKDIPFNTHGKSFHKYLELATFHVPVIASDVSPYREVIKDGENGFLAKSDEDWISRLEKLIEDKSYCEQVGYEAWKQAWGKYAWTMNSLAPLQNLFNG